MTGKRILIVDDDAQIRRVVRTTLVAQGYDVGEARTGEEALEKLAQQKADLVLLDINMPGAGGFETCGRIRSSFDAAIIMLTVRSEEEDKVKALDAGADDYVTKPFGMPELLARIRAALRRLPLSAETPNQILKLEDCQINFSTRRVAAGGKELRLTPKEFDLLQYLVAHPNVPIPHAKLLRAVWGPEYGEEVEYLHVFVNQLRKKIEKDPSKPKYLVTEPWVGYRFQLPE
jgi:two-component system, OmpR family, KDP operon response regulator KdpE